MNRKKAAGVIGNPIILVVSLLVLLTFILVFTAIGGGDIPGATAVEDEETGEQVTQPEEGGEPVPPGTTTPAGELPTLEDFLTVYDIKSCTSLGQRTFTGCGSASSSQIDFLYKILAVPLTSPTYRQLLTSKGKITIYLRPKPAGSCSGCTSGGADYGGSIIQYWGYVEAGDTKTIRVSMVHETGHIIRQRNPSLNNMPLADLASQDVNCYTFAPAKNGQPAGYYINTYANKNNGLGGGPVSETQAELIGMNVYAGSGPGSRYSKGLSASIPISDYPATCPASYNWIKANIYGGVDFYGLNPPAQAPLQ